MARWTRVVLGGVGGLAAAGVTAAVVGGMRWQRATARVVRSLDEAVASTRDSAARGAPYDPAEIEPLPAPVRRFFQYALTPGMRRVRRVTLTQVGDFAMQPGSWTRFTAEQHVSTAPRAFLWSASMPMLGVVPVRVRDSYRDGAGAMLARVAGIATVADAHDTPAMASGALLRWLAEAAWYPTALLPSAGVQWIALDPSTARATVTDRGTTVSLDVTFAPEGGIVRVRALRYAEARKAMTPWSGSFEDYRRVDGMMIPMRGEVGWGEGDAYEPYWRGRLDVVRYDFAPPIHD
ncbi:MAG: hypothetical protein MUF21_14325 [Gemmatimonadaceae bacterium]|nr:hypothetical protein [Gemmatimonadaceae bacterium]